MKQMMLYYVPLSNTLFLVNTSDPYQSPQYLNLDSTAGWQYCPLYANYEFADFDHNLYELLDSWQEGA